MILVVQVTWLVLCGMMLFSRFVFQAAGAVWMRSFLDTWKTSVTHRVWGWVSFVFGLGLLAALFARWAGLNWVERLLSIALIGVLSADGLLNLFPSWFGHFKERMQAAWVKRHSGERAGDKSLFGTVNFFLGLAAVLMAAAVYLCRPLPLGWVALSGIIAVVVMTILIVACRAEELH